jgi:D-glycero-D-manno-heptose 1,7-bisphosphate phosphatase
MENRHDYVREPAHIALFSDAVRALRQVSESGAPIILVTNQSAVGRGVLTIGQMVRLHRRVVDSLSAAGVRIAGTYICPHAPTDACGCRKPAPGMIREAFSRFRLDPARTALVGDAVDDMLAAQRAGVLGVLVRTGRGADQAARLAAVPEVTRTPVVTDLSAAVELLSQLLQESPETSGREGGAAKPYRANADEQAPELAV